MRYIGRAEEFSENTFLRYAVIALNFTLAKVFFFPTIILSRMVSTSRKIDILLDLSILKRSFLRDFDFFNGKPMLLQTKADAARAAFVTVARIVSDESVALPVRGHLWIRLI